MKYENWKLLTKEQQDEYKHDVKPMFDDIPSWMTYSGAAVLFVSAIAYKTGFLSFQQAGFWTSVGMFFIFFPFLITMIVLLYEYNFKRKYLSTKTERKK